MDDNAKEVAIWRLNRLIKILEPANGHDLRTLILPAGHDLRVIINQLHSEPPSHMLDSLIEQLESYPTQFVGANGIVIFSGIVVNDDQEERAIEVFLEPHRTITLTYLYLTDDMFHIQTLYNLLEPLDTYGYIVFNTDGIILGTVIGFRYKDLHRQSINNPTDRMAIRPRIRRISPSMPTVTERRAMLFRRVRDLATQHFVNDITGQATIRGFIGGSSYIYYRTQLANAHFFTPPIADRLLVVVEVDTHFFVHGDMVDFIMSCAEFMPSSEFVKEVSIISRLTRLVSQNINDGGALWVVGHVNTMEALHRLELLVVWEDIRITTYILINRNTRTELIKHLDEDEEADDNNFWDENTVLEVVERLPLADWLAREHMRRFECTLKLVSNVTDNGRHFSQGFMIGGIIRDPPNA